MVDESICKVYFALSKEEQERIANRIFPEETTESSSSSLSKVLKVMKVLYEAQNMNLFMQSTNKE